MNVSKNNLNISIATAPGVTLDIHRDIGLIKTGLLYGDKIKLFSLTSPILMFMYLSGSFDQNSKDEVIRGIMSGLCNDEYDAAFKTIDMLKRKKRRTPAELKILMKAHQVIRSGSEDLFDKFSEIAEGTGVEELIPALERDFIEVAVGEDFNYDFASEDFVNRYITQIMDETLSGNSFPMYDKQISDLINSIMQLHGKSISETRQEQIKHIATVHDVLSTLPDFAKATIQETIGIRDELEQHLVKYRAAMLTYSKKIKSMPWDKDFDNEVTLLFLSEVAPRIEEIRSIVEQNSVIRKFCTNLFNDNAFTVAGMATLGAVVLPLAQAVNLPAILLTSTSVAHTIGKNLVNTYNEFIESSQRAKENSFFFYYKAGLLLEK